ncbi:hypothetical protein Abr02nite_44330 [Paractinoplanes brasiliensis]|nr:hypothetical protein Abr02nite_44330 [Actinoplanes brasiliensis]
MPEVWADTNVRIAIALSGERPWAVITRIIHSALSINRGCPMFAALFGYGLAQIHRRLDGPWPPARTALHQLTGYAGGLGYAALVALIARRLDTRRGPITTALAALGQRSMTFCLTQSLMWALLFSSYTLNLHLTSPAWAVLIAVVVWLTTVLLADQLRRRGLRGPAETALRRLTYGPPPR